MGFNIKSLNNNFRVKKMNAIQLLALRSQIDFDNYKKIEKLYTLMLSNIEVEFDGQWLPVIEENKNGKINYYPANIEENVQAIDELIQYFMKEVLMPVFTSSNASK